MIFPDRRELLVAVAFMVLGASLIPAMNALAKYLASDYPVWQVVWARFLGHIIWMMLFFWPQRGFAILRHGPADHPGRALAHLLRRERLLHHRPPVRRPRDRVGGDVHRADHRHRSRRPAAPRAGRASAMGRRSRSDSPGRSSSFGPEAPSSTPGRCSSWCPASYYAVYQIWTRRLTLVDSPETLIVYTAAGGRARDHGNDPVARALARFARRPRRVRRARAGGRARPPLASCRPSSARPPRPSPPSATSSS